MTMKISYFFSVYAKIYKKCHLDIDFYYDWLASIKILAINLKYRLAIAVSRRIYSTAPSISVISIGHTARQKFTADK